MPLAGTSIVVADANSAGRPECDHCRQALLSVRQVDSAWSDGSERRERDNVRATEPDRVVTCRQPASGRWNPRNTRPWWDPKGNPRPALVWTINGSDWRILAGRDIRAPDTVSISVGVGHHLPSRAVGFEAQPDRYAAGNGFPSSSHQPSGKFHGGRAKGGTAHRLTNRPHCETGHQTDDQQDGQDLEDRTSGFPRARRGNR